MPAFGKNGIVNLDQSKGKDVWTARTADGKIVASSSNIITDEQKKNLSQQYGQEIIVEQKELKCL